MNVLFIPITLNHVRMFSLVRDNLPTTVKTLSLSIQKYRNWNIENEMTRNNLVFVPIDYYKTPKEFIEKHSIDIVVVGNDVDPLTNPFIEEANSLGIPTLLIQDGVISVADKKAPKLNIKRMFDYYSKSYIINRGFKLATSKLMRKKVFMINDFGKFANTLAVWGEFEKKTMIKYKGVDEKKIVITGNPYLDAIKSENVSREAFWKKYGIKSERKIILFATSDMLISEFWYEREMKEAIRILHQGALWSDSILVIRPHPNESEEFYKNIIKGMGDTFVIKESPLFQTLKNIDALITEISTVGLEATLFNKPVGIINYTGRVYHSSPYPEAYLKEGVALLLNEKLNVRHDIEALFNWNSRKIAGKRKEFIKNHLFKTDKKSSKRIARLMMKLVKRGKK